MLFIWEFCPGVAEAWGLPRPPGPGGLLWEVPSVLTCSGPGLDSQVRGTDRCFVEEGDGHSTVGFALMK